MDDFETELKLGFLEEAAQLITDTEQCFLDFESRPEDTSILEKIFRLAHNLKGSSKAVGLSELGLFTHEFETFLLKVKNGQIGVSGETVNILLRCNDHIRSWIEMLRTDLNANPDSSQLMQELQSFTGENPVQATSAEVIPEAALETASESPPEALPDFIPEATAEGFIETPPGEIVPESVSAESPVIMETAPDTSAVSPEALGDQLAQVTEQNIEAAPLAATPSEEATHDSAVTPLATESQNISPAAQKKTPASPANTAAAPAGKAQQAPEESIRVSLSRLEKLLNFVGEMVILQTVLKEQSYRDNPLLLRKTIHQLGKVTKEVQDLSMSLRMVPLKQTFQKMQRIVRDTSAILNKKVQLTIDGEETEVDKTVLENLGDPLVHIIRNAVDHGIETPADRVKNGKSETGNVKLSAFHQSGKLIIEIRDDGGGINPDRLRAKAIEKGILKPGTTISDRDAIYLIFHPGFSTKAQVTEVSGRGVGMDVVKTNIEALQGEVVVESVVGQGSLFRIALPLTLAIIDGMVVKSGSERFIIPLSHVHESVRPSAKDVHFTTGCGEVLMLRGENLPIYRLSKMIGRGAASKKSANPAQTPANTGAANHEEIAIIVRSGDQPFATFVDDIIGQHQVVIKKLGDELQSLKGFSGSAILGDGKPALILELPEMVTTQSPGRVA